MFYTTITKKNFNTYLLIAFGSNKRIEVVYNMYNTHNIFKLCLEIDNSDLTYIIDTQKKDHFITIYNNCE